MTRNAYLASRADHMAFEDPANRTKPRSIKVRGHERSVTYPKFDHTRRLGKRIKVEQAVFALLSHIDRKGRMSGDKDFAQRIVHLFQDRYNLKP